MLEEIKRSEWEPYISGFNGRNKMRPTRLEFIGQVGEKNSPLAVETDFWMEDGLPLLGVSLEPDRQGMPRVQIMLGGESVRPPGHMTHIIMGAQRIIRTLDADGRECELEIEDEDGAVTILHF